MRDPSEIYIGMKVRIVKFDEMAIGGIVVLDEHLKARKIGVMGEVVEYVPWHAGDIVWVRHDDGEIGAYAFTEFEEIHG